MRPIRLTTSAKTDLIEIWLNVSEYQSDEIADQLIDQLTSVYEKLATFPEMGRSRDDFFPGYRTVIANQYLIFYRLTPDEIEIIRVLHGARNIPDVL
jgi:toxin ParE1/3/4